MQLHMVSDAIGLLAGVGDIEDKTKDGKSKKKQNLRLKAWGNCFKIRICYLSRNIYSEL